MAASRPQIEHLEAVLGREPRGDQRSVTDRRITLDA